jgi:hypothetical protein
VADYARKYKRGRWAGSTEVVVEAVTATRKVIGDWSGGEEPKVSIFAQAGGQSIASDDGDELERIITKELGRSESSASEQRGVAG